MLKKLSEILFGTEEQRKARRQHSCTEIARIIEAESLSCNNCNVLAAPIPQTTNKYRCLSCARQFSGTKHNIIEKIKASGFTGLAVREYYNEAEGILKYYALKK